MKAFKSLAVVCIFLFSSIGLCVDEAVQPLCMSDKFTALASELETCATSSNPTKCKVLDNLSFLPLSFGVGFAALTIPRWNTGGVDQGQRNGQALLRDLYSKGAYDYRDGMEKTRPAITLSKVVESMQETPRRQGAAGVSSSDNVISLDEYRKKKAQAVKPVEPIVKSSDVKTSAELPLDFDNIVDDLLKKYGIGKKEASGLKQALLHHAEELKKMDEIEERERQVNSDLDRANRVKSVVARDKLAAPYRELLDEVLKDKVTASKRIADAKEIINLKLDTAAVSTEFSKQNRKVGGAAVKAGLFGAVTQPLIYFGDNMRSYAAQKYCPGEKFNSAADEESLKKFAHKGFECKWNIASDRFWEIVLMNPEERKGLMKASPTLCAAFETRFKDQLDAYHSKTPYFDPKDIDCASDGKSITALVEVDKKIYRQQFDFADGKVSYKGSFLSGKNYKDIKGTTFTLPMDKDGDFLLPQTENAIFYSSPAASSLKKISQVEEYAMNPDNKCSTLENKDELNFSMARNPTSGHKLFCSVGEQVASLKTSFKTLTAYCAKLNGATSKRNTNNSVQPASGVR